MLFSWFNTSKVDAFVDAAKKAEEQLAKSHDLMLRHAMDFVQRDKPNLYQKARIANRMKWALLEARYPKPFVDGFAYALASVVAGANAQREI